MLLLLGVNNTKKHYVASVNPAGQLQSRPDNSQHFVKVIIYSFINNNNNNNKSYASV